MGGYANTNKFVAQAPTFVRQTSQRPNANAIPPTAENVNADDSGDDKVFPIDLTNARTDELLEVAGNCFWYLDGVNPTDLILVRFGSMANDPVPCRPKFYRGDRAFDRLYISNAAQPGVTATLLISKAGRLQLTAE